MEENRKNRAARRINQEWMSFFLAIHSLTCNCILSPALRNPPTNLWRNTDMYDRLITKLRGIAE